MKKLIAIFAVVFAVGVSVMAKDVVGILWNCKDLAVAQQLAASTPANAPDYVKNRNTIMLAYLTNPADFDTFAKAEAKVTELCPTLSAEKRFSYLEYLCYCQKTLNYGEAMAADARKIKSMHYLIYSGSKKAFAGKNYTLAERKANLRAGLQMCVAQPDTSAKAEACAYGLRVYTVLIAGDEDAVVVPFMKELYRQILPKVAVNSKWKKAAVIAGLALKARGVNVE